MSSWPRLGHSDTQLCPMAHYTNDPTHNDCTIAQGKALVRAIEALGGIELSGRFERWQTRLLQTAYKQRLRAIVVAVPVRTV
jgi:hypothetical protein